MLSCANATRCSICSDSTDRYLWLAEQFCGSLMACLFLKVFRLAIKFFGGFVATSAKIRGYLLRLGSKRHTKQTNLYVTRKTSQRKAMQHEPLCQLAQQPKHWKTVERTSSYLETCAGDELLLLHLDQCHQISASWSQSRVGREEQTLHIEPAAGPHPVSVRIQPCFMQ